MHFVVLQLKAMQNPFVLYLTYLSIPILIFRYLIQRIYTENLYESVTYLHRSVFDSPSSAQRLDDSVTVRPQGSLPLKMRSPPPFAPRLSDLFFTSCQWMILLSYYTMSCSSILCELCMVFLSSFCFTFSTRSQHVL